MTLFGARKKNRAIYEKTFDLITEACDRDSCNIPHEILKVFAETQAAMITIRELLINKGRDDDIDIFREQFELQFHELAMLYNIHREQKGDSWKEMPLDAAIGSLSEEIEEFWRECPDGLEGMYGEVKDIILVALMVANRLKDVIDLGDCSSDILYSSGG